MEEDHQLFVFYNHRSMKNDEVEIELLIVYDLIRYVTGERILAYA